MTHIQKHPHTDHSDEGQPGGTPGPLDGSGLLPPGQIPPLTFAGSLPTGGTAAQLLQKSSGVDYAAAWVDVATALATVVRNVDKSADEGRTTSSITSDTHLQIAGLATGRWEVLALLLVDGGTTGDFKVQWNSNPTDATGSVNVSGQGTGATTNLGSTSQAVTDRVNAAARGLIGAGTVLAFVVTGFVTIVSANTTFKIEWAQNTSDATATTVHLGSWLQLRKVA